MAKAILKVTKSYKIGAAHTLARSRIVTIVTQTRFG